jgi:hypothetical protein
MNPFDRGLPELDLERIALVLWDEASNHSTQDIFSVIKQLRRCNNEGVVGFQNITWL